MNKCSPVLYFAILTTVWLSACGGGGGGGTSPPLTDSTAPTADTFSPADEATAVAIGTDIVVTFSEAVQRGSGSIVLKTSGGAVIENYDAATSLNLSIAGITLTINPSADLAYSTGYKVEFAAGTIKDISGNNYAGVSDYNFTTANPVRITSNGVALKGPLTNALVCADENGNGKCDAGEPATRTSSDGSGSFTLNSSKPVPFLVTTDADTKDDRGNAVTPGTLLKAPSGSSVVSVATTMISAGATNDQVAKALGYAPGTDFTTLNPFKSGGLAADQYKFETAAMQVYIAISAIASGASSTGADVSIAFESAFKAMAETCQTATRALNLADPAVIDGIFVKTKASMSGVAGFDASKFEAARADLTAAVANVNTAIKAVTQDDFKNSDTSSLYSVAIKNLSEQVASRVKDQVPVTLADTANIAAILTEQKRAVTALVVKISDVVGFWEGSSGNMKFSALMLSDGTAWMVVNDSTPKVIRGNLKVNGGLLSGGAEAYTYGGSTKTPVAITATLNQSNLVGALTYTNTNGTFQRVDYTLSAAKNATFSKAATLAALAKTWTSTIAGHTFEWTFSSTGVLSGVDRTSGCSYAGLLALRPTDSSAIMNADITEQCDGVAAKSFTGVAYINENSRPAFVLISNGGPALLAF